VIGGELWLDEIWSLQNVSTVTEFSGLFLLHDDNNHLTTSAWIWLVSAAQSAWVYRLPALLGSIGTLALLAVIAARMGGKLGLLVSALAAINYLLVLYGTEARGYSLMMFGVLVVLNEVLRIDTKPDLRSQFLVPLGTILAALSHGSFLFLWIPTVLVSGARIFRSDGGGRRVLLQHGPASLVVVLTAWLFYRHLPEGSGPLGSYLQTSIDIFSVVVGGHPLSGADLDFSLWMGSIALAVVVILLVEIVLQLRAGSALGWIAVGSIGTIVGSCLLFQPRVLFVRYFIAALPVLLILLGSFLIRIMRASRFGQVVGLALIVAYAAGNLLLWDELRVFGRGQHQAAFRQIVESTGFKPVTLGSDQDFRTELLLGYFRTRDPMLGPIQYLSQTGSDERCPDWYLTHSQDSRELPAPQIVLPCGANALLKESFGTAELSGWNWFLYETRP
jgi:hypothetical protein